MALALLLLGGPEPALGRGCSVSSRAGWSWSYEHSVALDFIRPGKPIENCFVESFNDKFPDEGLNQD
jgi:putative transposase